MIQLGKHGPGVFLSNYALDFGPKIITKIFALFSILLAQNVFLTRKVVNVVGIFNFTTRRVFGAGSHAADYYVAWHVSAGEGELR